MVRLRRAPSAETPSHFKVTHYWRESFMTWMSHLPAREPTQRLFGLHLGVERVAIQEDVQHPMGTIVGAGSGAG